MGNAQSDQGEQEAWAWIKMIPVVNVAYAPVRAIIYEAKGNNDEAKRSGLDMASAVVDTATMAVPGLNVVKGAGVAGRVATKVGMVMAASTAQGGIEYGIDKGREEVDNGEITFGTPTEEARKVTSYMPGVNLMFDAGRAAAGENVEANDFVQGATTTAAWTLPGIRDFGKGDRMLRRKVPKSFVPDSKGGQTRLAKGNYIPHKKLAAQASEVAQHGGINAVEEGADRLFQKVGRQEALKEALQGDAKEERKTAEQIFSTTSRKTKAGDVVIAVAVVSLVAAGCYALYRWATKKNDEDPGRRTGGVVNQGGDERRVREMEPQQL